MAGAHQVSMATEVVVSFEGFGILLVSAGTEDHGGNQQREKSGQLSKFGFGFHGNLLVIRGQVDRIHDILQLESEWEPST